MTEDAAGDPVASLVRSADFDRYAAALFAPAEARPHLLALYAFDAELARVRDLVSEPMPGELRLQWWRDALADPERADAASHPIMRALEAAIRYGGLPRPALEGLIDAHNDGLYDDPVASVEEMEARFGATRSAVLRLATILLAKGREPGGADAAGYGGVALGVSRLIADIRLRPERLRGMVPADRMAARGVSLADLGERRGGARVAGLVAELVAVGTRRLGEARSAFATVDPEAGAAFLPLAPVARDLARYARQDAPEGDSPRWLRMARLWRASRRSPPF
ncbi:phytoene/squalene synthase family protein [Methylopila henanensis]|uniref:Phytoene/squalene synthase family protein n=1 Tax=Methylopila henanensis TaxID=873516 RepID=A0ABW4K2V5_9HYPH